MDFEARKSEEIGWQVAPMIDMVFILLVFFLATYAVQKEERRFDINLPESQQGTPQKKERLDLVVNLDTQGNIYISNKLYTSDQFELMLKRLVHFQTIPSVILRVDADCPHKFVIRTMSICEKAGVKDVGFATNVAAEDNLSEG